MKKNIYILVFCILFGISIPQLYLFGTDKDSIEIRDFRPYINYPMSKYKWGVQFLAGVSLTKLPTEVVEEEINQSPMLNLSCRFDTPSDFWFIAELKTNYIANYFILGWHYTIINNKWSLSFGNNLALWFGHIEFSDFSLKARGLITYPNLTLGIDFEDYFLTLKSEIQYSITYTDVDGAYFGVTKSKKPGFGFTFSIEQPLWNEHWILLGAKMNYATFYYQSWLSYSTLDEYLLYPELIFTFLL